MYTCVAHVTFQHLGIFQGVACQRVVSGSRFFQLRHIIDRILQLELLHIRNLVRNEFGEAVRFGKRKLLYTCDILDGRFGRHRTIRDDMRHTFGPVFFRYPTEYFPAAVIVEVGIDIGEGNTVRIQETFEQQVIFDRVDAGDPQTVGNSRTSCRSTAGTDRNAQFFAGGPDEVLHDQEVTGEPHRLHDVQLEVQPLLDFVVQIISVANLCPVVCDLFQVVGFQFDAV